VAAPCASPLNKEGHVALLKEKEEKKKKTKKKKRKRRQCLLFHQTREKMVKRGSFLL
jgi:hypothetical protein